LISAHLSYKIDSNFKFFKNKKPVFKPAVNDDAVLSFEVVNAQGYHP